MESPDRAQDDQTRPAEHSGGDLMTPEQVILAAPWFGLVVLWYVMPKLLSGLGVAATLIIVAGLVFIAIFSAGWTASELEVFTGKENDCGFCETIGEMVIASLLLSAIGACLITAYGIKNKISPTP